MAKISCTLINFTRVQLTETILKRSANIISNYSIKTIFIFNSIVD